MIIQKQEMKIKITDLENNLQKIEYLEGLFEEIINPKFNFNTPN